MNFGYEKDIFILNQPDVLELDDIEKYNATIGLSSKEFLEEAIRRKNKLKVHLEIETGMGRTGIYTNELKEFINLIKSNENIEVEGIYTHFSVADIDLEYTKNQIKIFNKAVSIAKSMLSDKIKYVHCQASSGILNTTVYGCNLVRPGIIIYGYEPFKGAAEKIDIRPVAKLRTRIVFIKDVQPGESVGYGRKYIAKQKQRIATVPLGFADGISRKLTNNGEVVICGKKAPMIGTICMDSFMVDISHIPEAKITDDVYIWDNNIITLTELSRRLGTIETEILTNIGTRVNRVFVE